MTLEATLAYRSVTDDYAREAASLLVDVWSQLGRWNRADYERFLEIVEPLMSGAARATASLTAAYYSTVLETAVTVDAAPIVARLPDQLLQPFTGFWHGLTVSPFDEALATGTSTAEATGNDIVHQAARDSAAEIDTRVPNKRYRRLLTGQSCSWCQFYSTRVYKTARSATFGHERCDCLIVPSQDVSNDFVDELNESFRTASGYDESAITAEITAWGKPTPPVVAADPDPTRVINHPDTGGPHMPEGTETTTETTDSTDTGETTTAPEQTLEQALAEVEKWKTQARKHEDRSKANASAAKELEAVKLATMDETQKAIEAAKAETRAAVLSEVGSQRVADKFEANGVSADVIDGLNLAKFLTEDGDPDVDAIKAWAEKVAPASTEAEQANPSGFPPPPDLGQGNRQTVPLGSDPLMGLLKGVIGQ